MQECKKCLYDESIGKISFDENGICNYCNQIEELKKQYGTGAEKGEIEIDKQIKLIKLKTRRILRRVFFI